MAGSKVKALLNNTRGKITIRRKPAGKPANKKSAVIAVLAAACIVVVAVCGKLAYDHYKYEKAVDAALNTDRFYSGIEVQGVKLGGMTMQQAKKAVGLKEPSANGHYNIVVTYGKKKWQLTQKNMSFTYDTDSILKKAYSYARSGDRETRYKQVEALKQTPKRYSIIASPDEKALKSKIEKIASSVSRAAVEPKIVSFTGSSFVFRDGIKGVSADSEKLWSDIKKIVEGKHTGTAEIETSPVPFKKSLADIQSHMQKLGTFGTVSTNNEDGTYNMERALLAANGTCIPAGRVFSFFGTVGPCDGAHGYRQAGAILNGRHTDEYGGGICQASTTIYGAAMRSGMTIAERYNHSIPPSYCPIGQDATVSYPGTDLKLKNPTEYPMYLVTSVNGRTLTATVYGYCPSNYDSIDITSQVVQTYPAPSQTKYVDDNTLPKGTVRFSQKARTGYKATASLVFKKNGNQVCTKYLNSSYYPPMPSCYSRGTGGSSSSSNPSSKG